MLIFSPESSVFVLPIEFEKFGSTILVSVFLVAILFHFIRMLTKVVSEVLFCNTISRSLSFIFQLKFCFPKCSVSHSLLFLHIFKKSKHIKTMIRSRSMLGGCRVLDDLRSLSFSLGWLNRWASLSYILQKLVGLLLGIQWIFSKTILWPPIWAKTCYSLGIGWEKELYVTSVSQPSISFSILYLVSHMYEPWRPHTPGFCL